MAHDPTPRRLKFSEWLQLAEAWLTLAWVDLGIRLLPFRYWRRWLAQDAAVQPSQDREQTGALITAAERAARHHLLPMNCLRRSLAQQRLLRRRGIPSRLHLGVRKGEEGIEAHAWLSNGHRILNDTPDVTKRYVELTNDQNNLLKTLK